jgi:hypothetical protein
MLELSSCECKERIIGKEGYIYNKGEKYLQDALKNIKSKRIKDER